ncbi:MAG: hypothetical protein K6D96_03940 [Acetatifactor sp.]|nr:hypothetical protein [Acetatifactor sp.]
MTMVIDQFFVGEDGSLVLADDCGNITYCDNKRFKVEPQESECMFSDYPDMPYQFDNMTGSMNL